TPHGRPANYTRSIHPYRGGRGEAVEGADAADAVPGIAVVGCLALAFIALQEARHEEFLGQCREHHPAALAILHSSVRVVEIDDLDDGAWLRGVIRDLVAV